MMPNLLGRPRAAVVTRITIVASMLLACPLQAQTAPEAAPATPAALELRINALPDPDLSALEPAIQEQHAEATKALDEAWPAMREGARTLGDAFGSLGMHYHAYGLVEPARAAYVNAQSLSPDPRWPYYQADLAFRKGDLDGAIARYQGVLEDHPDDLAALVRLGRATTTANRLDEARLAFERARAVAPDDPAVLAGLGEVALHAGDAHEAVALLERALEQQPAANRLHHPLGLAYRQLGDLDKARTHLEARGEVGITVADPREQALLALVTGERILLLRGRQAFSAGRWAEAAEAFRQAADAAPDSARARVNLGAALGQLGDTDGAIAAFEESLRIDPKNGTAYFNLGTLVAPRDLAKGIEYLERALSFQPTDGEVHRELGRLLRQAGRAEAAVSAYRNAIRARAEDEAAHMGLAALLIDLGRYRDAVEALDIAHSMLPREGRIAVAYARILAAGPDPLLRNGEKAFELATMVVNSAPTVEHAELVAMALGELDRCDEAAEWQAQALESLGEEASEHRSAVARRLAHYRGGSPCRPPLPSPN